MASLGTFPKQPAEVLDYDIDFSDYLPSDDTIAASGVIPTGATVTITSATETVVTLTNDANYVIDDGKTFKCWLSSGTDGVTYKITVRVTTVGGRVKEVEFKIKCKDA